MLCQPAFLEGQGVKLCLIESLGAGTSFYILGHSFTIAVVCVGVPTGANLTQGLEKKLASLLCPSVQTSTPFKILVFSSKQPPWASRDFWSSTHWSPLNHSLTIYEHISEDQPSLRCR